MDQTLSPSDDVRMAGTCDALIEQALDDPIIKQAILASAIGILVADAVQDPGDVITALDALLDTFVEVARSGLREVLAEEAAKPDRLVPL